MLVKIVLALCLLALLHAEPLRDNFVIQLLPRPSPKRAGHPFVLSALSVSVLCNNKLKRAVPGDGGTQLWANLTGKKSVPHYVCAKKTKEYFNVWLNLELFAPLVIDCWVDNMKYCRGYVEFTTLQAQVAVQCNNRHDSQSRGR